MIQVLDSTLREGMQSEGIAFSVEDKLKIAYALDELGIDFIEAGTPFSNPKDVEFFERIKPLKHSKITAFGSTRRKDTNINKDPNITAMLNANTHGVTVFGKSWDMHVKKIINTSLEENLAMIKDTIDFFKEKGKYVIYDAEHFFDGYLNNEEYAIKTVRAAQNADVLCLCDTNGGVFPIDICEITAKIKEQFLEKKIGIHAHNDCGMGVANTIFAIKGGAEHIQGTLIGYGERCGNASLSTVIPNLEFKLGLRTIKNIDKLTRISREVANVSNIILPSSSPYVGYGAFAHKGGMHIDGVTKLQESFEHINPEQVGNTRKFLMSEVSGKASLIKKIQEIDSTVTAKSQIVSEIMGELKKLEKEGYQFEAAEESFELIIRRALKIQKKYFELEYYKIIGEYPLRELEYPATAVVKVKVGEKSYVMGAEGNGPVHALDLALRNALSISYPSLKNMSLKDYKVRVLESNATTAAKVRVLIVSTDKVNIWSTVGVSTDIIEASFLALSDSIEYKLIQEERQ